MPASLSKLAIRHSYISFDYSMPSKLVSLFFMILTSRLYYGAKTMPLRSAFRLRDRINEDILMGHYSLIVSNVRLTRYTLQKRNQSLRMSRLLLWRASQLFKPVYSPCDYS